MLRLRGRRFCTAATQYLDHDTIRPSPEPNIWVRIAPEASNAWWAALVDTAAPWCIVEPKIAEDLGLATQQQVALSTRLGVVHGQLHRVPLVLLADDGEPLTVDATVFASAHWPGPNIIGYRGFLERIRFAVDPATRRFYFGKL